MQSELIFMSGFIIFILMMLAIDLGLFTKSNQPVTMKHAAVMSAVWITLALCFYVLIFNYGHLLHHIDSFAALQQIANRHNKYDQ